MPEESTLLRKLLDYVVEQSKDIDPRGFKLNAQRGFLRLKPSLAGLPGVVFDQKVEGDHIWLRVERLEATAPPVASPESLRPLLTISDNPAGKPPCINEPALAHRLASQAAGKTPEQLQQETQRLRTSIEESLAKYAPVWQAWATGEKPRRETVALYGDLFALKHQLETEETAKPQELVWGMGVTSWNLKYTERDATSVVEFQYPLLTQALEIAIEEDTMALLLRPRGVEPRLEFDAFTACQLLSAPEVERAVKTALERSPERLPSPFDALSYEPLLKLVAGNLHERGRYVAGQDAPPAAGEELLVSDAWVILSRPRSNNYLHEDIERLKRNIAEGAEIPSGSLALVTPPSAQQPQYTPVAFRGLSGISGAQGAAGAPRELYFPLPYNHEQVTIIEQLERSEGVAVQGPPGTGKTHTIANIVCHYLATGRKVLVTSKGEQALEVLQSKLPESVRPLTVALLSGDREGLRQFQTAIEAIIHNVSQLNPEVVRTEIEGIRSAIDRAHAELAKIDRRVDDIAVAQLSDLEVDGVRMRAQKMAQLVMEGAERFSWFDDELTLGTEHAPPLAATEAADLRETRRRLGEHIQYVGARLPSSLSLPGVQDIAGLHEVLVGVRELEEAEAQGELLSLRASTPQVLDEARKLLAAVEAAAALAQELEATGQLWTAQLRTKCRQAEFASERTALEALFEEVNGLVGDRAEFLKRPVDVPEAAVGSAKFAEAVERGAQTGKPLGFLSFAATDTKQMVAAVRIAGIEPREASDWAHVQRFLKLHERVRSFSVRWNEFAELMSLPAVQASVKALRELELIATNARKAHQLATNHDAHLPALAQQVFAAPPLAHLRGTSSQLLEVREHLRKHLTRAELMLASRQLADLQAKLAGTSGAVSLALLQFVSETLGAKGTPAERAAARYAELVAQLRQVEALCGDLSRVERAADQVERAGASRLAARLRSVPVAAAGDDPVLPVDWRDAWNWARLRHHLESIEARQELLDLASRRRDLEGGLARLYEDMVSKCAWRETKLRASALVLSALETYRTAVRRIGQGTGPNATRHRRDAQRAMHDAQGAVPCWVMSHNKVSETLPAILGSFDLVVVDEASQSDLWALPAVLRGRKILVVGDDKQVSPDGGFISAARILELKERFLADQPYAPSLTPEKSLYDIAATVFAAQKVMLREHFRCVPTIIAYSNGFYNGFMQPLRIPKQSERIDPPLVDVFVPSGYRDKKDLNRPEADFIVAEIRALLADPRFAGRTLGVVSLLGPEQAKYIDTQVRSHCDAAELMRRKFDCGDARVFQGSERDIMFLSMVVDPSNCRALSGNMFEQRFNVAASRARDRMYLVRSVELKDLSPADLRQGLLAHFSKPQELPEATDCEDLAHLCESGFEREVYGELVSRGFRVVPQVKAGAFRIDMVVEGARDARLAIELDGDEFHGPDRWAHDMGRQRVLERAGWTFWRCFASTWSLRRQEVLQELLQRLTSLGIEPLGALDKMPEVVETRVWAPKEGSAEAPAAAAREAVPAVA